MKTFLFSVYCILILLVSSCKKTNEATIAPVVPPFPAVIQKTWTEKLNGSIWVGMYHYTIGEYKDVQPFGMELNEDGSMLWADEASTRSGGTWKAEKDQIILSFPNSTKMTADLGDSNWSNFTTQTDIGFVIDNLSLSTAPASATLDNTVWTGFYFLVDLKIKFFPANKFLYEATNQFNGEYTIHQGAMKFESPTSVNGSNYYFGIFMNHNTEIKGIHKLLLAGPTPHYLYVPWSIIKQ